jgi:hypothetical protein
MGALVVWLIVGALAGWIAGLVVEGVGFGLIGNIEGRAFHRIPPSITRSLDGP